MLGPMNLIALGIGAIIGTGIFVLTGQAAAANAGPAIVLSMVDRRRRQRARRPVLRGVRVDRADRRLGLHLRLRDARRIRRVDHRLGSDPRVRARRGDGRRRLVRQRRQPARRLRRFTCRRRISAAPGTVIALATARPSRRCSICRPCVITALVTWLLVRGVQRIGHRQRRHRRRQGRDHPARHRGRRSRSSCTRTTRRSFRRTRGRSASSAGRASSAARR